MRSTLVACGLFAMVMAGSALAAEDDGLIPPAELPRPGAVPDPHELIRKYPADPRAHVLAANAAMKACDLGAVERNIRAALAAAEKHPQFTGNARLRTQMQRMLASAFAMGGQHAKALQEIDALLKGEPTNPEYLFMRAQALVQLGRLEDALADTDTIIGVDSGHFKAWQLRAFAQYRLKRFEEAVTTFTIIKENTDDLPPVVLSMRGQALAAQGKYGDAVADYDAALKLAKEWREQLNTDDLIERDIGLKKSNAAAAQRAETSEPGDAAKIRAHLFEADQKSLLPTNSLRCE